MAANKNKLPPYSEVPPRGANPYHADYDQAGDKDFVAWNQRLIAAPQGAMQPTILINRSRGSDLTLPAILVCCFCCCCTGIPAIIYASKAQNDYGTGNWEEAERKQRIARGWIVGSVVAHIAVWVIFIILYFTAIAIVANKLESEYNN